MVAVSRKQGIPASVTCSEEEAQKRNLQRGENNISAYYAEPFHYRWLSES